MILYISILLILVNTFFGLMHYKFHFNGLIRYFFAFSLLIVLAVIMGKVGPLIADYENYFINYTYPDYSHFEFGYVYLMKLGISHGMIYSQFRYLTSLIGMGVIAIAITRFTNNINLAVVIYSFFPFLLDVIQVRNFFMMAMVMLGSSFLKEKKIVNLIVALLCILIGASFHSLGYFFIFPVISYYFLDTKSYKRIILIVLVVITLLFIIPGIKDITFSILGSGPFGSTFENIGRYTTSTRGNRFLIDWARILGTFIIFYYLNKEIESYKDQYRGQNNSRRINEIFNIINLAYFFSLFSLVTLPFIVNNSSYERVYRGGFILITCAILYVPNLKSVIKKRYLIYVSFGFVLALNFLFLITASWASINGIFHLSGF